MTTATNLAKQAVHDKFESQIKTAEAKLETLKARATAAKANVELQAIAELLPKKQMVQDKLGELKESSGDKWEQVRGELESRIAELERSVSQGD
jgi:phage shock protein A